MNIRRLQKTDRTSIEALLRSDGTFREDEIGVALELVDDALSGPKSDYWFFIACEENQVLGYVCYGPTPMTKETFDLYWIAVDKGARGQGVASKLVGEMESDLRNVVSSPRVRVETSQTEGYGAARKFYERMQYPEASRLKDFYQAGDDLITFYKEL